MKDKYILNSNGNDTVHDHLIGLARINPHVKVVEKMNAIVRKDIDEIKSKDQVIIISGGGAGHEPMYAGFVGPKLLTAAISGAYFASPSAGSIVKLVEQIADHNSQVLLMHANYTGDRLNFGLAKEYLTLNDYKNVDWFVFGDDLSPFLDGTPSDEIERKRRGLAGILFIHKIAGVLSERGKCLKEIKKYLQHVSKFIFTLSISVSGANIPGRGPSFQLDDDQMEVGLGIHGESGIERTKFMSADKIVELMLDKLLHQLNKQKLLKQFNQRIALIVNNLGGLIGLEMHTIHKEIVEKLSIENIKIERIYSGSLDTSFNMKGFSISILLVDDFIMDILNESDSINHGYCHSINKDFIFKTKTILNINDYDTNDRWKLFDICPMDLYKKCIEHCCNEIIKNESNLNQLDTTVGDSDCGSSMSAMAKLFLNQIQSNGNNNVPTFGQLSKIVNENIGGCSGGLYSILFASAQQFVKLNSKPPVNCIEKINFWTHLVQHLLEKISCYGGAKINDRSMLDGLNGIIQGLKQCSNESNCNSVCKMAKLIAKTTWTEAKKTAKMKAKVGRASYVNPNLIVEPDPGAYAVAIWTQAIADTLMAQFNDGTLKRKHVSTG